MHPYTHAHNSLDSRRNQIVQTMLCCCRCQYLGEGSTACILGVFTGLVLLLATLPSSSNTVDYTLQRNLLSFSSAAFFT